MTPLVWNTLEEATAYLTLSTGKIWTNNEVLSAAIEYPISIHRNLTFIQVAMPRETRFGVYVFDMDIGGMNPFRRKRQFAWIPIRLRQFQVGDLLIHGEVQISSAGDSEAINGLSEGDYVFIEPLGTKNIVNLDMLGIARNDLKELARKIEAGARSILDPPHREIAIVSPKEKGRRDKQLEAILAIIVKLQFEPLKIPNGGKAKIKTCCLENVSLFTAAGFGHAWKAGLARKKFKLECADKYKR